MLKFASKIPEDVELAVVYWGQSNARPHGDRDDEAFVAAPYMQMPVPGMDLTILSIAAADGYALTHGHVGSRAIVTVAESMGANDLIGGELRFNRIELGQPTPALSTLVAGHAKVIDNDESTLTVEWVSPGPTYSAVTCDDATDIITWTGHRLHNGDTVKFNYSVAPTGISSGTAYYVINADQTADTFQISATEGGAALDFSSAGTDVVCYATLRFLGGYVHLHNRWKTYENVRVLHAWQSEEPAPYTGDLPLIPGYEFGEEVETHEDCGLFLDFSWNEGIDGIGDTGTASSGGSAPTTTTMTDSGASWPTNLFAGGYVRCGGSRAGIASNTGTVLTLDADGWVGGTPNGGDTYEIHVPHWRDQAHHYDPGEGFRFPSNDHLPGGNRTDGDGKTYNRPKGYITPDSGGKFSYVARKLEFGEVRDEINSLNNYAQTLATATNDFVAGIVDIGGTDYLRIQRTNVTASDPATARLQFTDICYPTGILLATGFSGTSIASAWNIFAVNPVEGLVGSFVDLSNLNSTTLQVPTPTTATVTFDSGTDEVIWTTHGRVAGQVVSFVNSGGALPPELVANKLYFVIGTPTADRFQISESLGGAAINLSGVGTGTHTGRYITTVGNAGAACTMIVYHLRQRYGSAVEFGWRFSAMLGRRINLILMGMNGSRQVLREDANLFGYHGDDDFGWFSAYRNHDWTPSNAHPRSNANRLKHLIQVVAPNAIEADPTTAGRKLKVIAIVGFQMEGDSVSEAGRQLAPQTITTMYEAIRKWIVDADLSPYPPGVKVPALHAQIRHDPWELDGEFYGLDLEGDVEGLVNAAIVEWSKTDGFGANIDTDDSPTLEDGHEVWGIDRLHFDGEGEVINATNTVDTLAPVVEMAFSFLRDARAIEICNLALSYVADGKRIASFDEDSVYAQLCDEKYDDALLDLLQRHAWAFALQRIALEEVTNPYAAYTYAYALPPNVLRVERVAHVDALDYPASQAVVVDPDQSSETVSAAADYSVESDTNGTRLLLTNQAEAGVVATVVVNDVSQMSPTFRQALAWNLAARLAVPLIKGAEGIAYEERAEKKVEQYIQRAAALDANTTQQKLTRRPPGMINARS